MKLNRIMSLTMMLSFSMIVNANGVMQRSAFHDRAIRLMMQKNICVSEDNMRNTEWRTPRQVVCNNKKIIIKELDVKPIAQYANKYLRFKCCDEDGSNVAKGKVLVFDTNEDAVKCAFINIAACSLPDNMLYNTTHVSQSKNLMLIISGRSVYIIQDNLCFITTSYDLRADVEFAQVLFKAGLKKAEEEE